MTKTLLKTALNPNQLFISRILDGHKCLGVDPSKAKFIILWIFAGHTCLDVDRPKVSFIIRIFAGHKCLDVDRPKASFIIRIFAGHKCHADDFLKALFVIKNQNCVDRNVLPWCFQSPRFCKVYTIYKYIHKINPVVDSPRRVREGSGSIPGQVIPDTIKVLLR